MTIWRGVRLLFDQVQDLACGPAGQGFAFRSFGQGGAVVGQGHAQGFHQAVHAVGGEHARARAAGGAGVVFEHFQPLGVDLARLVGAHAFEDRDQVDNLAFGRAAGRHRSTGDKNGRDVHPHGCHQHARDDLVAVGDADHAVKLVGFDHGFDAVGDQFARGQGIFHPAVPHGDAVVHADGVEFEGHTAGERARRL